MPDEYEYVVQLSLAPSSAALVEALTALAKEVAKSRARGEETSLCRAAGELLGIVLAAKSPPEGIHDVPGTGALECALRPASGTEDHAPITD